MYTGSLGSHTIIRFSIFPSLPTERSIKELHSLKAEDLSGLFCFHLSDLVVITSLWSIDSVLFHWFTVKALLPDLLKALVSSGSEFTQLCPTFSASKGFSLTVNLCVLSTENAMQPKETTSWILDISASGSLAPSKNWNLAVYLFVFVVVYYIYGSIWTEQEGSIRSYLT